MLINSGKVPICYIGILGWQSIGEVTFLFEIMLLIPYGINNCGKVYNLGGYVADNYYRGDEVKTNGQFKVCKHCAGRVLHCTVNSADCVSAQQPTVSKMLESMFFRRLYFQYLYDSGGYS